MATDQESEVQSPVYEISTLSRAFSKNSARYQRIARRVVYGALILIGLSTFVSAFHAKSPHVVVFGHSLNAATAFAVILFAAAVVIRVIRITRSPERIWFSSRALAERTRSLAWQYAVAGGKFARPANGPDAADGQYQRQLDQIAVEARDSGVHYRTPPATAGIHVITDWMRATRALSLDQRRAIYAKQRIEDQERFYITREQQKSKAATRSQWILVGIEILGALLAALNALGVWVFVQLDFVGVAGTIAAGVATWVQFNQFTELAGTYSAMAYRMAGYRERCLNAATEWTETCWADFVGEVEGALSEEHGAWRHTVQRGATDAL